MKFTAMTIAFGLVTLSVSVPVYAQQQEKCWQFCQKRCTAANVKALCESQCMGKCMSSGQQKKN